MGGGPAGDLKTSCDTWNSLDVTSGSFETATLSSMVTTLEGGSFDLFGGLAAAEGDSAWVESLPDAMQVSGSAFDDDWFASSNAALLMKGKSEQFSHDEQQSEQGSSSALLIAWAGLVAAVALLALVAYRYSSAATKSAATPNADSPEMTLKPLPENAAELI